MEETRIAPGLDDAWVGSMPRLLGVPMTERARRVRLLGHFV